MVLSHKETTRGYMSDINVHYSWSYKWFYTSAEICARKYLIVKKSSHKADDQVHGVRLLLEFK
jgi:hypothetical protein